MKKLFIALVSILVLFSLSSGLKAQEAQEKSAWYIGLGFGTGDGEFTESGVTTTYDDFFAGAESTSPKIAVNLGLGLIFSPYIHAGFEVNALRQTGDYLGATIGLQINNYLGVITFFPSGDGFFLRGGLGSSAVVIDISYGTYSDSIGEKGSAALLGLGYALKLGQTFHLTLNFDYSVQKYNTDYDFDSSFWAAYVSFYWF